MTFESHQMNSPSPIHVPELVVDPRHGWSMAKAQLGGGPIQVEFDDLQEKVINAMADEIIPPAPGWLAPSEVHIVGFVARYVTPKDEPAKYYPFAAEDQFKQDLEALGKAFLDAPREQKIAQLKQLEHDSTDFFEQMRGLTYYGYYAQPEIVAATREHIPAARDYHGPPQPYGYLEVTERWDDTPFPDGRGTFVPTDQVRRVEVPESIRRLYNFADQNGK